jgi:hypothetical protein
MGRRIYEKYEKGEVYGALILKRLTPYIGELLNYLESKLADYETISVEEWAGERFYIIVEDKRIKDYPECAVVGFTVNIDEDDFIFIKSSAKYPYGGNCFVRGLKWKRLLPKSYFAIFNRENFHWYKSVPIPLDS